MTNYAYKYRSANNFASRLAPGAASPGLYALLGIKMNSATAPPAQIVSLMVADTDVIIAVPFMLIVNPTVAGTFTYGATTGSNVLTAIGTTSNIVTSGTTLATGMLAGWETSGFGNPLGLVDVAPISLTGTDTYVLAMGVPSLGAPDPSGAVALINWLEPVITL